MGSITQMIQAASNILIELGGTLPDDSAACTGSGFDCERLCAAGSDLLGQCSAALAAISIVFEKTDPSYALELLAHARDLYACAPPQTCLAFAMAACAMACIPSTILQNHSVSVRDSNRGALTM